MTEREPELSELSGAAESPWRRLDVRMLLVHPLQTFVQFLPAILALVILRSGNRGDNWWELAVLPVIVAVGVLRWLTTRYRIADGAIELRRGLLNKQVTRARLDRVRTVDLTAKVQHRLLRLAKVEISTGGAGNDRLVLDSLGVDAARSMRAELLHRSPEGLSGLPPPQGEAAEVDAPAPIDDEELLRLEPAWIRFAPLTLTGLAAATAVFGLAASALQQFGRGSGEAIASGARRVTELGVWINMGLAIVLIAVLAVIAYVLNFWGFRLTRNQLGSLHTRRGLLTTRETSIDHRRLRGLRIDHPIGLRLGGARRLKAVSTGLAHEGGGGSDWLSPPAPAAVVLDLAERVVPDRAAVAGDLVSHGSVARRRRLVRAIVPSMVLAAGVAVANLLLNLYAGLYAALPALLVCGVALGLDRYAGLGHVVTPEHLTTQEGSLDRQRVVLQREGIIGWTVKRTFFQRRAGVVTLTATTAAGRQHYDVLDVSPQRAYGVMTEISPDLVAQFR